MNMLLTFMQEDQGPSAEEAAAAGSAGNEQVNATEQEPAKEALQAFSDRLTDLAERAESGNPSQPEFIQFMDDLKGAEAFRENVRVIGTGENRLMLFTKPVDSAVISPNVRMGGAEVGERPTVYEQHMFVTRFGVGEVILIKDMDVKWDDPESAETPVDVESKYPTTAGEKLAGSAEFILYQNQRSRDALALLTTLEDFPDRDFSLYPPENLTDEELGEWKQVHYRAEQIVNAVKPKEQADYQNIDRLNSTQINSLSQTGRLSTVEINTNDPQSTSPFDNEAGFSVSRVVPHQSMELIHQALEANMAP